MSKILANPRLFWPGAIVAALAAAALGYFIAANPEQTVYVLLLAALIAILYKTTSLALYITAFLPLIGELYRLPFGPENGILVSDAFIAVALAVWLIKKFVRRESLPKSVLLAPLIAFIAVAALSLLQSFLFLKPTEVLTSSMYLFRFVIYAALYLIVLDAARKSTPARASTATHALSPTSARVHWLLAVLTASSLLLAIAGFIQLAVYPDLGRLEEFGWDPHINRLVSTWLDPNFAGGLFAFMICILTGVTFYAKKISHKLWLTAAITTLAVALFLTYSRSAYLALAIGIIVIGLLKSRKLLIACAVIFLVGISLSPRAEERVTDLTRSISSLIFNTAENPDPTARLRIKSWEQTLELIAKRPILGSGYNTLRYVKFNEGFVTDPQIHSASGSDSSLLTILATTGIAGLIPFLWFYARTVRMSLKTWLQKKTAPHVRGLALGLLAGVFALLTHSFFVNSLLFAPILIFLMISVGILESRS